MKRVTLKDVSTIAGTSVSAVSRVINRSGYVAEDVRQRIEAAIEESGYVAVHRHSTKHNEKLIGLIFNRVPQSIYFDTLCSFMMTQAEKRGYNVAAMFATSLGNNILHYYVGRLLEMGVSGIVVAGFADEHLSPSLHTFLLDCGTSIVFVERAAGSYGFNRVLVDNAIGTFYATRHLIERGHKHLLYISRSNITSSSLTTVETSRANGFRRAIEEAENSELVQHIVHCDTSDYSNGYLAIKKALADDPAITGVLTWNDGYAAGVLQYLYERGICVPDDIEVIGHDDTYAPLLAPAISSVRMPFEEMSVAAIDMIIAEQSDTHDFYVKTVTLEPRLMLQSQRPKLGS